MGIHVDGTGDGVTPLGKTRRIKQALYTEGTEATSRPLTQINLSAQAQQIRELRQAVEGAPSMHPSRVEALKQQVQNGTYKVESEKLAQVLEPILR